MNLGGVGPKAKYLIRDPDAKFPALLDQILAEVGVQIELSGNSQHRQTSILTLTCTYLPAESEGFEPSVTGPRDDSFQTRRENQAYMPPELPSGIAAAVGPRLVHNYWHGTGPAPARWPARPQRRRPHGRGPLRPGCRGIRSVRSTGHRRSAALPSP